MTSNQSKSTNHQNSAKTAKSSSAVHHHSAKRTPKKTASKEVSFGKRFCWVVVCIIISSLFLIGADDMIFGTGDRILADYTGIESQPVFEVTQIAESGSWTQTVLRQLGCDIFVPMFWGLLITIIEVILLTKFRILHRNATSAILIAALWLLPVMLAAIRLVSFYAFIY